MLAESTEQYVSLELFEAALIAGFLALILPCMFGAKQLNILAFKRDFCKVVIIEISRLQQVQTR